LAWRAGDAVPRRSFAVMWNRSDNKTYEATVDLTGDAVLSIKHVPDVTPNFTVDEFHEVDEALRKHPDVTAKLRERGIEPRNTIRKNSAMLSRLPAFIKKAGNRDGLLKLINLLEQQ